MKYQLKIDLTHLLGPNYNSYGVTMTENYPEVVSSGLPVISYLWYPIEFGQIPYTYEGYFKEKLAVTDPAEAKQMINAWNSAYIPEANAVSEFKIGKKRYSIVEDPHNADQLIILANYADRPARAKIGYAGSGGYLWQRLPNQRLHNDLTTHGVLKTKFNLRLKSERDRFINHW